MKEILTNPIRGATSMRLLIRRVWADIRDGLKEDITKTLGNIVVVWIRK